MQTSLPVTMTTAHGPLAGTLCSLIGGGHLSVLCAFSLFPVREPKERNVDGGLGEPSAIQQCLISTC